MMNKQKQQTNKMAVVMGELCSSLIVVILLFCSLTSAGDISSELTTCEDFCVKTYSVSIDEASYCQRGCRLLRLIDVTSGGEGTADDLQQVCTQACESAYDGSVNSASQACSVGCQKQIPITQARRLELEMFLHQQISQMLMYDFFSRLINCQSLTNNMEASDSSSGGLMFSARIFIVNSDPDLTQSDIDPANPVHDRDLNQFNDPAPNLSLRDNSYISRQSASRSVFPSTYNVLRDPSILFMFAFGLLLVVGFTFLLSRPVRSNDVSPAEQKLSIYGDSEMLAAIDDIDDSLIDVKSRAALLTATKDEPRILLTLPVKSL